MKKKIISAVISIAAVSYTNHRENETPEKRV